MSVFRLTIFFTLILTVQCGNKTAELEELSHIIRSFTGTIADGYMSLYKPLGPYSSVFSGLRIVDNLITMFNLGSEKVKTEIKKVLGLTPSLEKNGCDVMNSITTYDAIEKSKTNVAFNSTIFYRPGMEIKDEAMKSSCIAGRVQLLNFTDQEAAMDTINDLFYDWDEIDYGRYIMKPLDANTNELILNHLLLQPVLEKEFHAYWWQKLFKDIKGVYWFTPFMAKFDYFFFELYKKHNVYLISQNFVDERFSYVVIFPKYRTEDMEGELRSCLVGEVFSDILLKAASLTNKTWMGMTMPHLHLRFRIDLKDILPQTLLRALGEETALSGLTSDLSNVTQFPHSEFTEFAYWFNGPGEQNLTYFQVDKPFIFVMMDNKFNVPLQVTFFAGVQNYLDQYDYDYLEEF